MRPQRPQAVFCIVLVMGLLYAGSATAQVTADTQSAATEDAFDFGDFADLDLSALLDADVGSASGKVQSISQAPAIIEVITRDQIRAWGASTLVEIMQNVVGATAGSNALGEKFIGFRMEPRGYWDNRTLLLVDGFPLYEIGNGSMLHDAVPLNAIDRIEVIRGPAGVMFGTNAFSGVINIITRKYEKSGGDAAAAIGTALEDTNRPYTDTKNRVSGEVRAAGRYVAEKGYLQLHGQFLRSSRFTAYAPETSQQDVAGNPLPHWYPSGFTSVALHMKAGTVFGDNTITVQAGFLDLNNITWSIQPRAGMNPMTRDRYALYAALEYARNWGDFSLRARGGYLQDTMVADVGYFPEPQNPGYEFAGRTGVDRLVFYDKDTSRADVDLRANYDFGPLLLTAGYASSAYFYRSYQLRFPDGADGTAGPLIPSLPQADYTKVALDNNFMLEGLWNAADWLDLLAGMRVAYFLMPNVRPDLVAPQPDFTPNPRGGAVLKLNDSNTVKLLYGRAFRYPSLYELFAEVLGVVVANPSLNAEVIDSWEVAYDTRPIEGLSLRANAYINHITNELVRVPVGTSGAVQHINTEGSLYYGVEFLGRYVLTDWLDARATFGFIEGYEEWVQGDGFDCAASGNCSYIADLARFTGSISASLFALDRMLTLTPIYRFASATGAASARHMLDTTLEYHFTDAMSIGIVGKNITNTRYLEPEWANKSAAPSGTVRNTPANLALWYRAEF